MSEAQKGCIYKLIDPTTLEVRYVGQTVVAIKKRLFKHISDSYRRNTHVANWIQKVIKSNGRPIISIIENAPVDQLDAKEIYYISFYRTLGYDLVNTDLGGRVNRLFSQETKDKISQSLKGRQQSCETKEKRSASLKEVWKSATLRELKRKQTTELNKLGVIGTKGKPSSKKGKPFFGDKAKLSASLKEHYKTHEVYNKTKVSKQMIYDYMNSSIPLVDVAAKYNINRCTLTSLMKSNNIKLRRDGSKAISKEQLVELINQRLTEKRMAEILGCSKANIRKFKRQYNLCKQAKTPTTSL